jgi:hypothetical protein
MAHAASAVPIPQLVLGRYRPIRPLGSGGSGSVWLVRDEESGLDVALKIIPREGKAAARAEREAAAAARLRHSRCIRAYAFSRDADHVYIVYEYVPGRTLREALRAGAVDDATAIEVAAQVCDGIAHAHASGILHRDVKPSNVLLAEEERGVVSVRILDFGLARMQEAETLTAQGDVPGTLAYIAPERLAGDDAGEAGDVWSIGVLLWEALAGQHPFWTSSMMNTARAIEAGAPSLANVRPDLPKVLISAVDRALSREPARRPSAAQLSAALRGAKPRPRPKRRGRARARVHKLRLPTALRGTPQKARSSGGKRASARVHKLQVPTRPAGIPRIPGDGAALARAALAALFVGWTTYALPFFPAHWWIGLAALCAAVAFVRPRLGLAIALAMPVLPLGNISLGLALFYAAVAAAWLVLAWGEPTSGLVPALGVALGPLAALGLLPLAAWRVHSPVRRALQVALAVLVAAVAAGLRGVALPFTGAPSPLGVGVVGADDVLDVAGSLGRALAAQPQLLTEALVLAVAAVALPYARRFGRWGVALLAAWLLVGTIVLVPSAHAVPLVLTAWATAVVVALTAKSAT